jgi:hypothetical protein
LARAVRVQTACSPTTTGSALFVSTQGYWQGSEAEWPHPF